MSVEIQKLAIVAGDIVAITTSNPHVDATEIARASGATVIVLRPGDSVESLDSAQLRRAGFVPVGEVGANAATAAEVSALADAVAQRDITIAENASALSGAQAKIDNLTSALNDAQKASDTANQGFAQLQAHTAAIEAQNGDLLAQVTDLQSKLANATSIAPAAQAAPPAETTAAAPAAETTEAAPSAPADATAPVEPAVSSAADAPPAEATTEQTP